MASKVLPKTEQNSIRFVKVCTDVLKLPLIDILASEIQPTDLYSKIQQNPCSLLHGKNELNSNQRNICNFPPPVIPDYNKFDVTLLYKLIRNLCPSLAPTKGWGKDPVDADTQIGDDIERLRLFRNNNIHKCSSGISDNDFEIIWKKLKSVFQRIQSHMKSKGYNANYEEKMNNIKQLDLGDETFDKYKFACILDYTFDCLNQTDEKEEPMISIEGQGTVFCGDTAIFNAVISPEHLKGWSVTWQKLLGWTNIHINTKTEKYNGSTDQKLCIHSVCKEDEGTYQAILSRYTIGKTIIVVSNSIFLQVLGGLPMFDVWNVTTGVEGINICYGVKKEQPYVNEIKWTKDGEPIDNRNKKYNGGELKDKCFTITSPTLEDRGIYSCLVKNAVGITEKTVTLDVPTANILTKQLLEIFFGFSTALNSNIASIPSPDGVEWQTSNDGKTFDSINIRQRKYYGSSCNYASPSLVIPNVAFEDKLYYRLLVWNKIGERYSNSVFINVIGSRPNITTSHITNIPKKSLKLIGNVFVYENYPQVKSVYWTKNGNRLVTQDGGGRYSDVSVEKPSLTISDVNEYDAGSYQLTATNDVGSTASDFIILDVPVASISGPEKKQDGGLLFTVTIQSVPAPYFVQWSLKEKICDTFIPIDEHVEEFKGTSNNLPEPVLVIRPKYDLENYCFQIEVRNFIGSCKQIVPDEASSGDVFTNENQVGRLSEIYLDGGAGLNFANLFDYIAENFPKDKTKRLLDFIRYSYKVKDMTLFARAVSARDYLGILCDQKIFTPLDVIFVQYLLKKTNCMELFEKCRTYAEAHTALCFYEKLPENGFKNVQFHVRANLSRYTQIDIRKIQQTVAAIVGCNSTEIVVCGYYHSASFLVVLSVEKKYVRKLLTMEQQKKDKLIRLNIDYFIVDFILVYLQIPKESEIRGRFNDDHYQIMLEQLSNRSEDIGTDCGEKQSYLSLMPNHSVSPPGEISQELSLIKRHSKYPDMSTVHKAVQTASINVSLKEVKHISCLMPNRLWVSDMKKVQEIDEKGHLLRELDICFTLFGSHTLTKSGDLLFLKDNDVYMLTSKGEIRNLFISASLHFCIHSSRITGDILIGDINIVTRYNNLGMKIDQIEFDNDGRSLYVETIFITENINGDIIVSDNGKNAIVAINNSRRHLFSYKGHRPLTTFRPGGICTDVFGQILVCNVSGNPNVQLLDQKGHFLAYLLTEYQHGFDCPQALCVDSEHNLYVGFSNDNEINVYRYIKKKTIKDMKTTEAEMKKELSGRSYKKVQFHTMYSFSRNRKSQVNAKTIDTVRTIVGCDPTDIHGNLYDESNNSLELEINELFLKKILSMTPGEKSKLRRLDFDFFIADFITVYLKHPEDSISMYMYEKVQFHKKHSFSKKCRLMIMAKTIKTVCSIVGCFPVNIAGTFLDESNNSLNLEIDKMYLEQLLLMRPEDKNKLRKLDFDFFIADSTTVFIERPKGVASSQAHLNTAIQTKRITVFTQGVKHISCLTSNKIWVSDLIQIGEIDKDGQTIMKLDVDFGGFGRHTVTREENLVFLMNGSVYILTSNGDIRNLNISASESSCIHASRLNGDIFVGAPNGVNRYSESSKNFFKIQVDNKGVDLYRRPIYITENKNGDIIVSDKNRKAIVVVDKQGRHRFNYKGNNSLEEFYPRGICTDVFGHILICNHSYRDPSVHLLDENGQYLTTLLTKQRSVEDLPQDVCVDDKYNLYVAWGVKNIIDVYSYLQ